MENKVIPPKPGILKIRAYCSRCGKLLQESNLLTKKQLLSVWDRSVIQAASIPCKECGTKFPNFELNLRIYNTVVKVEHDPLKYIHPKHKLKNPLNYLEGLKKQILEKYPELEENDGKEGSDGESSGGVVQAD